jgi:hypothetical protein
MTKLTGPDSRAIAIFEELQRLVQASPFFAPNKFHFRTMDGFRRNHPRFQPNTDQLPMIELEVLRWVASRETEGQYLATLEVRFNAYVLGCDLEDRLMAVEIVRDAVDPIDRTRVADLDALANWSMRLDMAAQEHDTIGSDDFASVVRVPMSLSFYW